MTLCGDNWLYEEASLKKSGSSFREYTRYDNVTLIPLVLQLGLRIQGRIQDLWLGGA